MPAAAAGAAALGARFGDPAVGAALIDYRLSTRDMIRGYRAAEAELSAAADAVAAIPAAERTFANTVLALENADAVFSEKTRPYSFLADVSPDKNARRAGNAIERRRGRFFLAYGDRDDIYRAYKEYAAKGEQLTGEDKLLLDDILRAYKMRGMDRPLAERINLKAIHQRLDELSQNFENNLAELDGAIEVDLADLKGLPPDYIDELKTTPAGKRRVTLDDPTYWPFMRLARSPELRRQLHEKRETRAAEKNVPILEEALVKRRELAGLMKFKNYADMVIAEEMAGSAHNVWKFLKRIGGLLRGPAREETAALLEEKRREYPAAQQVRDWERLYYSTKLKKRRYDFENEEAREYFPADTVVKGTLEVYQELLGLEFQRVPAQAWHEDVELYTVADAASGRRLGYFYMDLLPRRGKYGHNAMFPLIDGHRLPDGGYRMPVAALIANLAKKRGDQPGLMYHGDVETFFHEFGHVMHHVLTEARYVGYSGTNVAMDFVEMPSQMMENFVWQPEILAKISGHYQDRAKKLPPALLGKMLAARNFMSATANLWQVAFAAMDLAFNTVKPPVDTTALLRRVYKAVGVPVPEANERSQASFGHLIGGYAARYYGYLWSEVYAKDAFSVIKAAGVLNPAIGMRYRQTILRRGSSVEEARLLRDFLGREPSERAFLESLGIAPQEKPDAPGVTPEQAREILNRLAAKARLRRTPVLDIVESFRTNAAAHKRGWKIEATTALLAFLNAGELEAVFAHEIGHLKGGTWRVFLNVALPPLLAQAVGILALMGLFPWNIMLGGIASLAALFWSVPRYFEREEFAADRIAARLLDNGTRLAQVLRKLPGSITDPRVPERVRRLNNE